MMVKNQLEQETLNVEREITTQQQNLIFTRSQLASTLVSNNAGNLGALEAEYKTRLATQEPSHPDMVNLRRQIAAAKKGGMASADGSLQSELDNKKRVLNESQQKYQPDHPDIRRLQSEIKQLEIRVAANEKADAGEGNVNTPAVLMLNSTIRSAETQIASLERRRNDIQSRLYAAVNNLAQTPAVQRDYDALVKDLGNEKAKYDELVRNRLQVEVSESAIKAGNADKFVLFSPPYMPGGPFEPNRNLIVILGCIAGVVIGLFAAVAAELMDSSVRGSKDIGSLLGVTPLAVVPSISNSRMRIKSRREWSLIAAGAVIGLPLAFFLVRLLVRT
jgi:uncharacterized protein involved in exopolysaccharide biosynthesis